MNVCERKEFLTNMASSAILEILSKAYERSRLAHAYIFLGNNFSFIRETLIRFGQTLHCKEASSSPCGVCSGCNKVLKGLHPDIIEVSPSGPMRMIRISQVRNLIEQLSLKPQEGKVKLAVIWEAETINEQAANAFLKTLEEPPPHSVIILVTNNLNSLLPTVISRCQLLRLGVGQTLDLSTWEKEFMLDAFSLHLLIESTSGDINAARELISTGRWDQRITITAAFLRGMCSDPLESLLGTYEIIACINDIKSGIQAEQETRLAQMEIDDKKILKMHEDKNTAFLAGEIRKEWDQIFSLWLSLFMYGSCPELLPGETIPEPFNTAFSFLQDQDNRFIQKTTESIERAKRYIQRNVQPLPAIENMMLEIALSRNEKLDVRKKTTKIPKRKPLESSF